MHIIDIPVGHTIRVTVDYTLDYSHKDVPDNTLIGHLSYLPQTAVLHVFIYQHFMCWVDRGDVVMKVYLYKRNIYFCAATKVYLYQRKIYFCAATRSPGPHLFKVRFQPTLLCYFALN